MARKKKIENSETENKKEDNGPSLSDVMDAIKGLGQRVIALEEGNKVVPLTSTEVVGNEVKLELPTVRTYESKGFVPAEFRRMTDELLGANFGIEVKDFEDTTDFQVTIVVPDEVALKAKTLTPSDVQLGHKDTRTKMISRALGSNGVREWVTKVRNNLNKTFVQAGVASPLN